MAFKPRAACRKPKVAPGTSRKIACELPLAMFDKRMFALYDHLSINHRDLDIVILLSIFIRFYNKL